MRITTSLFRLLSTFLYNPLVTIAGFEPRPSAPQLGLDGIKHNLLIETGWMSTWISGITDMFWSCPPCGIPHSVSTKYRPKIRSCLPLQEETNLMEQFMLVSHHTDRGRALTAVFVCATLILTRPQLFTTPQFSFFLMMNFIFYHIIESVSFRFRQTRALPSVIGW
jgi:hypothetical protein